MDSFQCCDCGNTVCCYDARRVEPRCASCSWIRENVAPEHQTPMRERLGVPLREAD